ncbi:MAG TPA: zinc ribbon domain-containing protein [Candidatus Acidoferrales bacterium]|nr:zinc ribbon domain-containing protein [Candidatus Acidoferrales bacterium]
MSGSFTPGKPGDAPAKTGGAAVPRARIETLGSATMPPQRMIKCPKCGSDVREIARFCQRCHATLRYECPACKHEQRKGGSCEKCGVDFIKYISSVVAAKRIEADQVHDRIDRRTVIIKQVFLLPITGGISLIKHFLKRSRD